MGLGTDAKLDRQALQIKTRTFPRNTTDNISFDPPESNRPFQTVYDLITTQPKYNKNVTTRAWEPKPVTTNSICNRSGSAYDIISHVENKFQGAKQLGIMDKQVTNRKKGITEMADLKIKTCENPQYNQCLARDPYVFRRKNGIFSNMYDAAARFGED